MIYYLNDYNGGSLAVCDYLFERIKREMRSKAIQQSGYLIVKGLLKKKGSGGNEIFNALDDLFDIPRKKQKPQPTKEELVDEFEKFIGK